MQLSIINQFISTLQIPESEMNLRIVLSNMGHTRGVDLATSLGYLTNEPLDRAKTIEKSLGVSLPTHMLKVVFVFFIILSIKANAQSSHYWSQNFNTESSLVGGAVIGGDAGPSAVY